MHESVYWLNINADIENAVRLCTTCLDYQQTHLHEKKPIQHELPCKLWEVVDADIFSIHTDMLQKRYMHC